MSGCINSIVLKTDFKSKLHKDYYYDNVINILYGINNKHNIIFKDNNRYNISPQNIEIRETPLIT